VFSQFFWLLSRKINFGDKKANYLKKILANRKNGLETPRGGEYCVVPENIHTPPREGFWFEPSHSSGNSSLALYFPLKIQIFSGTGHSFHGHTDYALYSSSWGYNAKKTNKAGFSLATQAQAELTWNKQQKTQTGYE